MTHPTEAVLRALLQGDLQEPEADSTRAHLDECSACLSLAERLTAIPPDFWPTLAVATSRTPVSPPALAPTIPGYQHLAEIGRGGFGVVYRATETTTGRWVALKVLRAGLLASPEERQWFLAEARAAANLRHPGIVTVLSVGEAHGLPYYAMEHLPAGSLAGLLDGTPMTPDEAARLIESVALAVHHAHESGIIHRDLKPGNILLDRPPGAPGPLVPKVSDFGMAKNLEAARSATPSLAVVGTPSYMAPEQAFGQSHDVGPPADIYALGAVLHELLTGRPPFKGATPYETLLLVRDELPIPPRRLRPGLPRDLETICLKSLEKIPARRYQSAADLARDLRAYLDRRPVSARPSGLLGRSARWCRREPALAATSFAAFFLLACTLAATTYLWRNAEARRQILEDRRSRDADNRAQAEGRDSDHRDSIGLDSQFGQLIAGASASPADLDPLGGKSALQYYSSYLSNENKRVSDRIRSGRRLLGIGKLALAGGDLEFAEHATRQAVQVFRHASVNFPDHILYRFHLAEAHSELGGILWADGRPAEAIASRREGARIGSDLVGQAPDENGLCGAVASFKSLLALDLFRAGELSEAESLARSCLDEHTRLLQDHPSNPFRYHFYSESNSLLSQILAARGRATPYLQLARERLQLAESTRTERGGPFYAMALLQPETAQALAHAGLQEEALRVCELALKSWRAKPPATVSTPRPVAPLARWLIADGFRLWPTDQRSASGQFQKALTLACPSDPPPPNTPAEPTILAAWLLATCPDPAIRDPLRAIRLAASLPADVQAAILGIASFESGRYAESINLLDAAHQCSDHLTRDQTIGMRAYHAMALRHLSRDEQAAVGLAELEAELGRDLAPSFQNLQLLDRARRMMPQP